MKEFAKEFWKAFVVSETALMSLLYCVSAAFVFASPELDAFLGVFVKWSLIALLVLITLLEVMGNLGRYYKDRLIDCQAELIKNQDDKIKILESIIREHERAQAILKEMANNTEAK